MFIPLGKLIGLDSLSSGVDGSACDFHGGTRKYVVFRFEMSSVMMRKDHSFWKTASSLTCPLEWPTMRFWYYVYSMCNSLVQRYGSFRDNSHMYAICVCPVLIFWREDGFKRKRQGLQARFVIGSGPAAPYQ